MEVFKSVFDRNAKCHKCQAKFKLKRRRKCIICSKLYSEFLFCKICSIKENHHSLGFLAPKRYCKDCYATGCNNSTKKEITKSATLSSSNSPPTRNVLEKSATLNEITLSTSQSEGLPNLEEFKEERKNENSLVSLPSKSTVISK